MGIVRGFVCAAAALIAAGSVFGQSDDWFGRVRAAAAMEATGHYLEAANAFRRIVSTADDSGYDRRTRAWAHNALGLSLDEAGNPAEAEHEYRRSLALYEAIGAKSTPDAAVVLGNLGDVYAELNRYAQAESTLRESIAIYERTRPPSDPFLAMSRDSLVEVLLKTRRFKEIEPLLGQVRAAFEGKPAMADHLGIALCNLGTLRRFQHRYGEAAELFQRAERLIASALGPDHPKVLQVVNNLAICEMDLHQTEEAGAAFRRGIEIARARLGEEHPLYAAILGNYAWYLQKSGHKAEGKKLQAQSRELLGDYLRRNGTLLTVDVSAFQARR